jgi:hypothetical protein
MSSGNANDDLKVDLLWYKDSKGYALEDHGKWGQWIGRRGGGLVPVYPLRNDRAFNAFSNVSTSKELVEFMNTYGFLKSPSSLGPTFMRIDKKGKLYAIEAAPRPEGEDVQEHLRAASVFREVLNAKPRRALSEGTSAWLDDQCSEGIGEIQLVVDKHGIRPVLRPASLISGLFWQLISSLGGGARYRTCRHCGVLFQVGGGIRPTS